MKHLTAVLIKFGIIAIALEIVLNLLSDLTFGQILIVSVVVTVLAYLIGDLLILPMSNNTIATVADFGLALVTIYAFDWVYRNAEISFFDAALAALVLAAGEWFFHKLVQIFYRLNRSGCLLSVYKACKCPLQVLYFFRLNFLHN